MLQRTIRSVISAKGVAVHSGASVTIELKPAPVNTGIIFRHVDQHPIVEILAKVANVLETNLSTCLGSGSVRIGMVEHLMSAVAGLGIDNLYVDVTDNELPIMDGSAAPYVFLLQSAGIVEQKEASKRFLIIDKTITVANEHKGQQCIIEPYNGFKVSFSIDFNHPSFTPDNQTAVFDFSTTSYLTGLCRARTFGFVRDREKYQERNLALGSSMDNAVWLSEDNILNVNGLRYYDEFVRHKILDAIGDLYLLQYPLIGHFKGIRSGHALNNQLLNAILADEDAFHISSDDQQVTYLGVECQSAA